MNYGKIFEKEFKESAQKQGIWVLRINDTFVPAKAISEDSFVPQQPCDYVVHYDGIVYLLELKTTQNKYLTIERDEKQGQIKKHQYEQMSKLCGDSEKAYFILQFERDGEKEPSTYALSVENFMRFLEQSDKKSINKLDVVQYGGVNIESKLIRKNYAYNIKKFIEGVN